MFRRRCPFKRRDVIERSSAFRGLFYTCRQTWWCEYAISNMLFRGLRACQPMGLVVCDQAVIQGDRIVMICHRLLGRPPSQIALLFLSINMPYDVVGQSNDLITRSSRHFSETLCFRLVLERITWEIDPLQPSVYIEYFEA